MNIDNIKSYSSVLIKNNFLLSCVKIFEIFEKYNDFEKIVFTNKNSFFENYNVIIFNEINDNIINNILYRQLAFINRKKMLNKIILIFDGFEIDDNNENIKELIYNNRAYGILLIFNQCKIPKNLMNNIII